MAIAVLLASAAVAALILGVWRVNKFRPNVTADEVHMVTTRDLWKIRLCRYKTASGEGEPILLCHGFMSNQFNFAKPAGDAMVDYLARNGYDCWAIDLRGNNSSIPPFGRKRSQPTMDDYLLLDIPAAIEYIRKTTGHSKVHWIGHSMGGMLLYAYDAVFGGDAIASATTLGSPVGFNKFRMRRPTVLLWIGRMSRPLFYFGEWLLVQAVSRLKKNSKFIPVNWRNMDPRLDPRGLFSMLEVPPVAVAEGMIGAVNTNEWHMNRGEVEVFAHFPNFGVPLLAVYGSADLFYPAEEGQAALETLKLADKRMLVLSKANGCVEDYDHVDLVMGKEAHREVFPVVEDWLRTHPIEARRRDNLDEEFIEEPPLIPGEIEEPKDEIEELLAETVAAAKAPVKRKPRAKSAAKSPAKKPTSAKAKAKPAARVKRVAKKEPEPEEIPAPAKSKRRVTRKKGESGTATPA